MTIIYLVRHGQVPSNITDRHIGQRDDEDLTEEGQRQAKSVAELLSTVTVEAIYTSPLKRALLTAREIARLQPDIPLYLDFKRLLELDLGVFDNLLPREAEERYPTDYAARNADKVGFKPPRGENYHDLVARVQPFVDEVLAKHLDKGAIVVGHQGVNRAVLVCTGAVPLEETVDLNIPHAAYIRISINPPHNPTYQVISRLERAVSDA